MRCWSFETGLNRRGTPMRLTQMKTGKRVVEWLAVVALLGVAQNLRAQAISDEELLATHKTENVVVVMLDGLRWQEVFHGADHKLINKRSPKLLGASAQRTSQAKELFWRDTPEERRQVLMPFLWSVVASQGQVYGNRDLGSDAHVKNGM